MFYWTETLGGGSETLGGLGDMSKADILRGIVTEKLTTAAREILAVVERTVAGYEEEASGFRREINRQRKQLEALLQPRVKLEKRVLNPDEEQHQVVVGSDEEEEEEEEHTQLSDVEDTGRLGFLWYDDDDDDTGGEEQQLSMRPATSSRQKREDQKDPDYRMESRGKSDRRRLSRPQISDTRNHVDLRICVLEESETDVLSKSVFQKCPVQDVRCPSALQEADFLDLLRSTFPQLANGKPFDFFTSDRSRRLKPLRVKTLSPEEIYRSIKMTGAGHSALYVRLKTGEDSQCGSEDLDPPQRPDESPSSSTAVPANQMLSCPRESSDRRRRGRPRLCEKPTHHSLKICVLEDSQTDVLPKNVVIKSSIQELHCPFGLQEEDFLNLLRSTFPQLLGDDKPFDLFKSDRSRRLQRLSVKTLTPDEIYRSMKSTGTSLLYIRLKTGEEEEEEDAADSSSATAGVMKSDEGSSPGRHVEPWAADVSQQQDTETDEADDEGASEGQVDSCDDDWNPDLEQQRGRRGGAEAVPADGGKAVCKVCGIWYRLKGSLIKHAWSHAHELQHVCGVCGERSESAEDLKAHLRNYQKTHDCSHCGKSFLSVTGLTSHMTLHTGVRPYKCDVCKKSFTYLSGLSVHRWVHVAEKPHKCDLCPKAFGLKAQLVAHRKLHSGRDRYQCNICSKSLCDLRSLTRHKATHSGERRYGCQVCGKRFKLSGSLKSHEKIHTSRERLYLCHVCCKTFLSSSGLTTHMKTHSDARPFVCGTCNKAFISNSQLKDHMRVHTNEMPYGCSECGRFFKRRTHLTNHVRSHLGIKQFVCSVCGKACSRQEHLTVHMRTHNGERPYQCPVCDKAFTQSHCLKTHMKSHQGEDNSP